MRICWAVGDGAIPITAVFVRHNTHYKQVDVSVNMLSTLRTITKEPS